MVTVIIPCYNAANFIKRAIDSVLGQTHKPGEIILVNNNSTDNTLRLLQDYQLKYPGYIYVYNEFKKGAPAARNCGLAHSKGEWIQFLDADDELLTDKIETQLNIAVKAGAEVVAGSCVLKYRTATKKYEIIRQADKNIWNGLITSNLGITSANLWSKNALTSINGWNENVISSQEYDLLFRLLKNNATIVTDGVLNTIVHFGTDSISKSKDVEKLQKILEKRIALRLEIKEELIARALLTPELSTAIDTYIYTELIRNYRTLPDYAKRMIKQHNLEVKLLTVIKLNTKLYLQKIFQRV